VNKKADCSETLKRKRFWTSILALVVALAASALTPGYASNSSMLNALPQASPGLQLYNVKVMHGKRVTAGGRTRGYTLYVPEPAGNLKAGPYPLAVLLHGFLMTGEQQSNNAQGLAQRGFVVLTPDLTKVLLGDDTRMENVADIVDHIKWLTDKNGPIPGLVDANRVSVGGNSSGGAVILETALEAQKAKVPLAALVSLDGVIWDRSMDRIKNIQPVKFLSLRAETSICNEHARLLQHLADLKFPIDDVKVIGAHHCDVENPTTLRCSCVCGTSHNSYRRIFAQLLYAWLRDTFNTPTFSPSAPSFDTLVQELKHNGQATTHLNQPVSLYLSGLEVSKTK
jgi:dienelactone hydrolase